MLKYMPRMLIMETGKCKDGTMSLTYSILTRENYTVWTTKMRVFMEDHGLWEAIHPEGSKTTIEKKTNKIALAAIYQGVQEDILLTLAEKKTAKEAWEAVKTLCHGAERVKKARIQPSKLSSSQ